MGYYANANERGQLIAGLRALAEFLENNPDVPAPGRADVLVFPPGQSNEARHTEIDAIASRIGVVWTNPVCGTCSPCFDRPRPGYARAYSTDSVAGPPVLSPRTGWSSPQC